MFGDFNLGDRVIFTGSKCACDIRNGDCGKVIIKHYDTIGVEFDKYIYGHDCATSNFDGGKEGHCWFVSFERLKKIDNEEVELI